MIYLFVLDDSLTSERLTTGIEQLTKCCEPLQDLIAPFSDRCLLVHVCGDDIKHVCFYMTCLDVLRIEYFADVCRLINSQFLCIK